jgi:aminoglycoside phosphotransferase (APT) family kinase protein
MSTVNTRIPLQGGYANEIWKVRHDNHWLIEKNYRIPVGTPNPMYPNLPDHEARVLDHLSGTGIAPEFVSYTAARGQSLAQVTYTFVVGTTWAKGVSDVAQLLSKVHRVTPPKGIRRLNNSATRARKHGDTMIANVRSPQANELRKLRPSHAAGPSHAPLSLVHTDCGPGNLLRTRTGLVLIDWQCPGIGDPVEDLACFLSPAMMILYNCTPHSFSTSEKFLAAYPDANVVKRYRRDAASWHYRIAAYCIWRVKSLARSAPLVSSTYQRAATAELELLRGLQ